MSKPNVLLVVLDSTRADHTSVHGYDRPTTPNLELLAEDAYRFDEAFAAAPWTPPSHGSIFAGVHPTTHGFLDTGSSFRPPHAPLAERLRREGYRTFGAVQNSNITSGTEVTEGFDEYCDQYRLPFVPDSIAEFREYYLDLLAGYLGLLRERDDERTPGEHLTCEYVRRRIRRYAGGDPFFGFINILSPHSKYASPEPYRSRFDRTAPADVDVDEAVVEELSHHGGYRFVAGELSPTDDEWAAVQDRYDAEIAFADRMLGTLLDALREAGVYDETTIVVTSDHGEHFGEHGRAYHQFSLFDEVLHVPLLIKPPGGSIGRTVDDLVSLVDIYPTVLSTVGASIPETVEGLDLFDDRERDAVFAEYGDPTTAVSSLETHARGPVDDDRLAELDHALQCARTSEEKYLRVHGGEDRIYDVGTGDPKDTLRRTGRHDELAAAMSEVLGDDLRVEASDPADPKIRQNLEALGYR